LENAGARPHRVFAIGPSRYGPTPRGALLREIVEPVPTPIENISDPRLVRAMSHPLRVRILAILDERTASPIEMSRMLRASLGVVAYHVRTLHRLGLLALEREAQVRGAVQRFYRARQRPTVSAEAWAQAPPVAK